MLAGGQFSVALRYLLAGSPTAKYAISVSGRLEVPTGNSTIVGNATQLMPMVLAEWHAVPRLLFLSNIAWNTTVGGTTGKFANFEYANAVVWLPASILCPCLSFLIAFLGYHLFEENFLRLRRSFAASSNTDFVSGSGKLKIFTPRMRLCRYCPPSERGDDLPFPDSRHNTRSKEQP